MPEVRYRYDEQLARIATRRFLSRYARFGTMIVLPIGLAAIVLGVMGEGSAAIILGAVVIAYILAIWRYRRRSILLARELGGPEIVATATEQGLTFAMPKQSSTIEWSPMRELWQFDDVWLLLPNGKRTNAYTAIPTAGMSEEFRATVLDGIRAHGGKLK